MPAKKITKKIKPVKKSVKKVAKKPVKKVVKKSVKKPVKKITKKPVKRIIKKPAAKKQAKQEKPIGEVTHFFRKLNVAVIDLSKPLSKGDTIRIVGGEIDFEQKVTSMEINGKKVEKLYEIYKSAGIKNITLKIYPEGRHEMLNEINKDEVYNDIISWIKKN